MTDPLKPVAVLIHAQTGDHLSNLADEIATIGDALSAAGYEIRPVPAARLRDVVAALGDPRIRDRIVLLHYAGHSHGEGIQLQNDDDDAGETAYMAGLAGVLRHVPNLVLVFLNSCVSRDQVLALTQVGIPLVIATNEGIDDTHARLVAEQYYRSLTQDRNLGDAFDVASNVARTDKHSPRGAYFGQYQETEAAQSVWPWELHGPSYCRQWKLPELLTESRREGLRRRCPCQLPPMAGAYFGRKVQRMDLVNRLIERRNSVVAGPAGIGKTALAAEAVRDIVGPRGEQLAASPYPEGIVFVDLYQSHGQADPVWTAIANSILGSPALANHPPEERAREACRGRQLLLIVEGFEEADGASGRTSRDEFLGVIDPANTWLLLTRDNSQARPADRLLLTEFLEPEEAGALFDSLSGGTVTGPNRRKILDLLAGHPLALTWAGSLVASGDEEVSVLISDWQRDPLLRLKAPDQAGHTLQWLFNRSVRGLDTIACRALSAAGQLGRAPFPVDAIQSSLCGNPEPNADQVRDAVKVLVQRGLLRRTESEQREFTHVLGYQFARQQAAENSGLRKRLASWLRGKLKQTIRPGEESSRIAALLPHAEALLRLDCEQKLWLLADVLMYDTRDRLVNLGQTGATQQALQFVWDWLEQFPVKKAQEPGWQRERVACLNRRGDLALARGNLSEAERLIREGLDIRQRLAASDPANAGWQRDLSVSLNKLGDVFVELRNLPDARRLFEQDLEIAKRLAALDPENSEWQRDLSVSLDRLGAVFVTLRSFPEALRLFGEGLEIAKRLAASDPRNTRWQRDLSVSLGKLGDVFMEMGNLPEAQRLFEEGFEIRQRLAALDSANAGWQRDLAVSYQNLASLFEQTDPPAALSCWRQAFLILDALFAKNQVLRESDRQDLELLRSKAFPDNSTSSSNPESTP